MIIDWDEVCARRVAAHRLDVRVQLASALDVASAICGLRLSSRVGPVAPLDADEEWA